MKHALRWLGMVVCVAGVGCRTPDYVEATPYYGQTEGNVGGRPFDIASDGDSYGLAATVGWKIGDARSADKALSGLRIRDGAVVTRPYDADWEAAARKVEMATGEKDADETILDAFKPPEVETASEYLTIILGVAGGGALVLLVLALFRKQLPDIISRARGKDKIHKKEKRHD